MFIPTLPSSPIANRDGSLNAQWAAFFSQLITQMQQNLSNEGLTLPPQSTANIAILNNIKSEGVVLYDSTLKLPKVNLNGTFHTILTS